MAIIQLGTSSIADLLISDAARVSNQDPLINIENIESLYAVKSSSSESGQVDEVMIRSQSNEIHHFLNHILQLYKSNPRRFVIDEDSSKYIHIMLTKIATRKYQYVTLTPLGIRLLGAVTSRLRRGRNELQRRPIPLIGEISSGALEQ